MRMAVLFITNKMTGCEAGLRHLESHPTNNTIPYHLGIDETNSPFV